MEAGHLPLLRFADQFPQLQSSAGYCLVEVCGKANVWVSMAQTRKQAAGPKCVGVAMHLRHEEPNGPI